MNGVASGNDQVKLMFYASDILTSNGMQLGKHYKQHGEVCCYEHSLAVACMSIKIATFFRMRTDMRSLIRGALLQDYFLYDWHQADESHRLHGFSHAKRALKNAEHDFSLTEMERDIIEKHMFPMNPSLPRYWESVVVNVADKICAFREVFAWVLPSARTGGKPL